MIEVLKKSISLAIAMLIMMATIAVPVAMAGENAAKPIENENNTVGCSGCANNNGSCGTAGNATELQGAEKDKIIKISLKDKEVQQLQEQLTNEGFIQKDAKAYKVSVTTNDSKIIDVPVVEIKFNSSNGDQDKKIMFAQNPETGQTVVLLAGSTWDCISCVANLAICLGSCVVCGVACASPVNWLLCLPCIAVCGGSCVLAYGQCYTCYYGHPP